MFKSPLIRRQLPQDCLPVQTGSDHLSKYPDKVNQIASLTGLPHEHFRTLYVEALSSYAGFVQAMPVSSKANQILLDTSLNRVIRALNRRRSYLLPAGAQAETIAVEADFWTYAVFLASLLRGFGEAILEREVELFDKQCCSIGRWNVWGGPIVEPAVWYRVSLGSMARTRLYSSVIPFFVPHIVPTAGMKWLFQNYKAMDNWIAAITEDTVKAGILGEIIELPGVKFPITHLQIRSTVKQKNETTVKPTFTTSSKKPSADELLLSAQISTPQTECKVRQDQKTHILASKSDDPAQKFLVWLRKELAQDRIRPNQPDSHVHLVADGVLLVTPAIFQDYGGLDWQQVQKRFLKLNIHRKVSQNENFQTYSHPSKPSKTITGLLIPDSQLLLGESPGYPFKPGHFVRSTG